MTGQDMRRSETEHLTALLNQAADTDGMTERFTYGTDPSQFMEVYGSPDNATRAVVFIHGGYFRDSIDLSHARPMARALALQGAVVGLLEYRRAKGTGGHPQTLEDVTAGSLPSLPAWLRSWILWCQDIPPVGVWPCPGPVTWPLAGLPSGSAPWPP